MLHCNECPSGECFANVCDDYSWTSKAFAFVRLVPEMKATKFK